MTDTITVPRATVQQALDALGKWSSGHDMDAVELNDLIATLEAALEQPEQEPVAYTGDVARRMREAGVTFHLGMPRAVVIAQMTRFHDLVCAEASIKAAVAFAHPPRREWQGLTEDELGELMRDSCGYPMCPNGDDLEFARAIEAKLKERNA